MARRFNVHSKTAHHHFAAYVEFVESFGQTGGTRAEDGSGGPSGNLAPVRCTSTCLCNWLGKRSRVRYRIGMISAGGHSVSPMAQGCR
jgi:hypothetical protein